MLKQVIILLIVSTATVAAKADEQREITVLAQAPEVKRLAQEQKQDELFLAENLYDLRQFSVRFRYEMLLALHKNDQAEIQELIANAKDKLSEKKQIIPESVLRQTFNMLVTPNIDNDMYSFVMR